MATTKITTGGITDATIATADIADDAVTAAKLDNTSVSAGSYGTASAIPAITVDAQGRITAASTNAVSIPPAVGGSDGVDFNDNVKARFGTGNDLEIYHDGTKNLIRGATAANINIKTAADFFITHADTDGSNSENCIVARGDGAVELYHDNTKRIETTSSGATFSGASGNHTEINILGYEDKDARLNLSADEGDDNADKWRMVASTDGNFYLQNYTSGSWEWNIKATGNGAVELYHDHGKKFETLSTGVRAQGGITFGSDTAAENHLDDYEEGTFTPVWGGAQAGSSSISYGTTNGANYVKVGHLVMVSGRSDITSQSGGSGNWYIGNLPYYAKFGTKIYNSVGCCNIENNNLPDDTIDVVMTMEQGNNNVHITTTRDNASKGNGINVQTDEAFTIQWSICYRAN